MRYEMFNMFNLEHSDAEEIVEKKLNLTRADQPISDQKGK